MVYEFVFPTTPLLQQFTPSVLPHHFQKCLNPSPQAAKGAGRVLVLKVKDGDPQGAEVGLAG